MSLEVADQSVGQRRRITNGRETITGIAVEPGGTWWLATDNGLEVQRPNGAKSSEAPAGRAQPQTSGNS